MVEMDNIFSNVCHIDLDFLVILVSTLGMFKDLFKS